MLIKKSELPQVRGLAGASVVNIRSNAQIDFSSQVAKVFGDCKLALVDWDEKTRKLSVMAVATPPKGLTAEDCVSLKGKKGLYFSAGSLLQKLGYKYKEAGNQSFPATTCPLAFDGKTGALVAGKGADNGVTFDLPAETPKAKPVVRRPRKAKEGANGEAGKAQVATEGQEAGEELELEPQEA